MSLKSKIAGKTKQDKEFREILLSVEPDKGDYSTLSGMRPFSNEYSLHVPYRLSKPHDATLVGTAFDYLARFRIAQFLKKEDVVKGLVALKGFKKIPNWNQVGDVYISWMETVVGFIKNSSLPTNSLIEISVHLAKLEQIARANIRTEDIKVEYLLHEPANLEVKRELEQLVNVFEDTFMGSDIIHSKSKVVFNPHFGVGSALVSGADADIFIDGTLYDIKTTKDQALLKNDNLQLIGYYVLNEIAISTHSDLLEFDYTHLEINRLAFYKARFGEIEYYDVRQHLPFETVKPILIKLAEHFKDNQGSLNMCWTSDINKAKKYLEEIRNGEV